MPRSVAAAACLLAALPVAPASAVADEVAATCTYRYATIPRSSDVQLVLTAEAHTTGSSVPAATGVVCVLTNAWGESVVASTAMPGPHVYTASTGRLRWGSPTLCADARAHVVTPDGIAVVDAPEDCGVELPL